MKIVVFAAGGQIGRHIVDEAAARGHQVIAAVRDPGKFEARDGVTPVQADAGDRESVARAVIGADGVISAVGPNMAAGQGEDVLVAAAHGLIQGLRQAGVKRLLVLGGAGSLEVAPGVRLVDAPAFPAAWKENALAQARALDTYRREATGLDWTYVSPAALIGPGPRVGAYRVGGEQLVVDAAGESRISYADYGVAMLDLIEAGTHAGERITVAY